MDYLDNQTREQKINQQKSCFISMSTSQTTSTSTSTSTNFKALLDDSNTLELKVRDSKDLEHEKNGGHQLGQN